VTSVDQAEPGVVIPPFTRCELAPDAGTADGSICTNIAVAGATADGLYYPDYGDCAVVRTQRPYGAQAPAGASDAGDPRLGDPTFVSELAWVTSQVQANACTCCHDSKVAPQGAAEWDISAPLIWTDTASNAAIALFSGYADSTILGHYLPSEDNGFERTTTGLPSTDATRMQAFWNAELARRGMTEAQAAAVPPFGGPLITEYTATPKACVQGIGVDASGTITWGGVGARYIYLLDRSAANPLLPPDEDLPPGIVWRLDVLASADALDSGISYGVTPPGTFQHVPATGRALALKHGTTYHLFILQDIGIVSENCLFTF
jgi:hypothetical protein